MTDMKTLRAEAKRLGINSFGMKKADLEAAVAGKTSPARFVDEPDVSRETRDRAEDTPRRRRKPLGTPQQKLSYPARDGYVRRWFNDRLNRLRDAEDAGYEFVTEKVDGRDMRVSRRVDVNEDGSPMMAYLMEIRREFYDEDQRAKQVPLDEFDAQLRRNTMKPQGAEPRDQSAFYTPDEGSSIRSET